MELLKAQDYLDVDIPDIVFLKELSFSFVLKYFLEEISTIAVFHHDAKVTQICTIVI